MTTRPDDFEVRAIPGSSLRLVGNVTDVDSKSHEVQVRFPHTVVDTYKTYWTPDTFRESYEKRMPIMCWQHDLRDPIGRATRAQALTSHDEIIARFSDTEAVPNARRAYTQIEDGTITDFSFGFKHAAYRKDPSKGEGVRAVVKATMVELSPVSVGSIPGAEAVGIREEGGIAVMDLEQLIKMREEGILTDEGFRALVGEHFPSLLPHIAVRAVSPGKSAPNTSAEDEDDVAPVKWTALESGSHTAEGPNGMSLRVRPMDDGKHSWSVLDKDDAKIDGGIADDMDSAKHSAEKVCRSHKSYRSSVDYLIDGYITAESVLNLVRDTCPDMHEALEDTVLEIRPKGDEGVRHDDVDLEIVANLAQVINGALEGASQWLERADIGSLPDDVQQGIALVSGASASADALLDVLGIEEGDTDVARSGLPPEQEEPPPDDAAPVIGRLDSLLSRRRDFEPNVGGGVTRDKLKDSDFVFSDERKFPVVTPGDVSDAVRDWGRYRGSKSFSDFKSCLTALAHRKGPAFTKALPAEWTSD